MTPSAIRVLKIEFIIFINASVEPLAPIGMTLGRNIPCGVEKAKQRLVRSLAIPTLKNPSLGFRTARRCSKCIRAQNDFKTRI